MSRAQQEQIVHVPAGQLVIDHDWNSRRGYMEKGKLDDATLRDHIEAHGVLQPIRVRRVHVSGAEHYSVVVGFRRAQCCLDLDPDTGVPCVVVDDAGLSAEEADAQARAQNLSENIQREDLKPWHVADALFRWKKSHPGTRVAEMAKAVGMSRPHASNLASIRRRAGEDLWEAFKTERYPWKVIAEACKAPKAQQMERLAELSRGRVKDDSKRGSSRPSAGDLSKYHAKVAELAGGPQFHKGVRFGLAFALGTLPWPKARKKATKAKGKK